MKYKVYSIRDNKVGFGQPFVDISEQSAIRGFSYAVNNKDGIMGFSPNDFDLFEVGAFDSETGVISSCVPCVLIVSGSSVCGG